jgi:hypothetical protein
MLSAIRILVWMTLLAQDIGLDDVVGVEARGQDKGLVRVQDLVLVVEPDVFAQRLQRRQRVGVAASGLSLRLLVLCKIIRYLVQQRLQCGDVAALFGGWLGWCRPGGRQDARVGGDIDRQRLLQRRITDADIGAALADHLDLQARRGGALVLQRQLDGDAVTIGFHLAEEFVILDLAGRHHGDIEARRCVAGLDQEFEALAVHVVSGRDPVFGDQRIAVHAGAQGEGFLGRQQFFFLGL